LNPIISRRKLPLNDALAVERTHLANERTLLAYLRSGLALIIAGATIIHFSDAEWFKIFGIACVPTGMLVSFIGWRRFTHVRHALHRIGARRRRPETK